MEQKQMGITKDHRQTGDDPLPAYTPPKIVTYTSEDIMEQIGPAHACSPTPVCGGVV